ncbi:MAG: archaeosortase/exosortase family protein [Lentisphaerae bacterium]|nr:archaeosortase/exosortase family protein [Lentisphaerota bacterium]
MNDANRRPPARLAVLSGALGLFLLWMVTHLGMLTATQNGWIRFALTLSFATMIILRPKPGRTAFPGYPGAHEPVLAAITGTACVLVGVIFQVQQAEWIGLLLMFWGCLRWALPRDYRQDLTLALVLLYWAHPLPGRFFGPMELALQHLSVRGAECLLLGLDIRVWADQFVLHTGFTTYEVPGWCSGMRTATTVFLLGAGLAILNRFKAWECALTVAVAVIQALVLNILRIATLVILVPRLFGINQAEFLHNTTGFVVIASVFLVYGEVRLWRRWRLHGAAGEPVGPEPDHQVAHPTDWLHVRRVRWAIALTTLLVAAGTAMVYRNGPRNRLAVLKDVATAAHDAGNFEEALLLTDAVIARSAADPEWTLKSLRLLLSLRRYQDVLSTADTMTDLSGNQAQERNVLRAYALMALDRVEDAAAIVRDLPESVRRANPRVAMILAVMAFRSEDTEGVTRNIPLAARWKPNLERIRLMYPFLRQHRQWQSIVATASPEPYTLPEPAFSAIEANMNLDQPARVASLTGEAVARWPGDPRILEPLFYLAAKSPDSAWEDRFGQQLRLVASRATDPGQLYEFFDKCFELGRPDLAWGLYRRMHDLDASHPALAMTVVRFGGQWFAFRRRSLGLASPTPMNTIDLRPFYQVGRNLAAWSPFCAWVPEGAALAAADPLPARQRFLDLALNQFKARRAQGELSIPLRYLYANALEQAGRWLECREELESLRRDHPEEERPVRVALSEMYERAGDWQGVYETLRGFIDDEQAGLTPLLRFGRACLNLRLNLIAFTAVQEIRARYPRSAQADALLAATLLQAGEPDEALQVLDSPRPRQTRELDMLRAQTLFHTQRYVEAEAFCHSALMARPPIHAGSPQPFMLPPAELAHMWHQFFIPSEAQFARNADVLKQNLATTSSPFLQGMMSTWLSCYAAGAQGDLAAISRWEQIGRDPVERALLLNQLTLLQCRFGRFEDARGSAERAVALLPACSPLWRWLIGLSGADAAVIAQARAACPSDSEIWLADLVARANTDPTRVMGLLTAPDSATTRYPAETVARAGEFLMRREMPAEAAVALRDATRRALGLLPIYVQGLRCALAEQDREWATECTKQALLNALHPPTSLYRKMVDLKMPETEPLTDIDMVEALKHLRQNEPDNVMWAQLLGYVRFKRGGWEVLDAYNQMDAALSGGATNRLTFTIAAEASRLLDNPGRAADILRRGAALYPEDLQILNNLAYLLTLLPDGLPEAQALLPRLQALAPDDPRVMDTIAAVAVAAGQVDTARAMIASLTAREPAGSPLWFRAQMHEAQLRAATNDITGAMEFLDNALGQSAAIPDDDVVAANRLIARWRDQSAGNTPPDTRPDRRVGTPLQLETLPMDDEVPVPDGEAEDL